MAYFNQDKILLKNMSIELNIGEYNEMCKIK